MMYPSGLDIHICKEAEIEKLMGFINKYWSKNHILSSSKVLMDWQHYNKKDRCYNFVVALNKNDPELIGILGFIPSRHFDPALSENNTVWLVTWKIREDSKIAGLGLLLHGFLVTNENHKAMGTIGNNNKVAGLYKALGYEIGQLNQFYIINDKKENFCLVDSYPKNPYRPQHFNHNSKKKFIKIDKLNFAELSRKLTYQQSEAELPKKSFRYFYKRYLEHPIYNYDLYAIAEGEQYIGLVVMRCVEYKDNYALRIVDYFGPDDGIARMRSQFQELLRVYDAEYIDIFNYGINDTFFEGSGFIKLNTGSKVIIPNYYEPFEKRNVKINFAFHADEKFSYKLFKGDADQDRPNLMSH
ncbi:MAG: hypothetical protein NTW18_00865 [Candidatus Omnitrophica bacterium]|nr:hypothetical protein [Candidatus Omnitrophota bacterium]